MSKAHIVDDKYLREMKSETMQERWSLEKKEGSILTKQTKTSQGLKINLFQIYWNYLIITKMPKKKEFEIVKLYW